jgi:hypothetical protein
MAATARASRLLASDMARAWLTAGHVASATGLAAVAAPGSRVPAALVLESELLALEVDASGTARATLSVLLVEESGLASARLRGQFGAHGTAARQGEGEAADARAMVAALGAALAVMEAELATALNRQPLPR